MSGSGNVCRMAEEVCNLIVNRKEALGLSGRFEALHDALASSGRLMAVLGSIVQTFMLAMLHTRHDHSLRGGIAGRFVRDHQARCGALLPEQLAQQTLGGFRIAAALNQDIEHHTVLVHGAPEPMLPACNADDHLVEVPLVSDSRNAPTDLVR